MTLDGVSIVAPLHQAIAHTARSAAQRGDALGAVTQLAQQRFGVLAERRRGAARQGRATSAQRIGLATRRALRPSA